MLSSRLSATKLLATYYLADLVVVILSGLAGGLVSYYVASTPPNIVGNSIAPNIPYGLLTGIMELHFERNKMQIVELLAKNIENSVKEVFGLLAPLAVILGVYVVSIEREQGYSLMPLLIGYSRRSYAILRIIGSWAVLTLLTLAGLAIGALTIDPAMVLESPFILARPAITLYLYVSVSFYTAVAASLILRHSLLSLAGSLTILYAINYLGTPRILEEVLREAQAPLLAISALAPLALAALVYLYSTTRMGLRT